VVDLENKRSKKKSTMSIKTGVTGKARPFERALPVVVHRLTFSRFFFFFPGGLSGGRVGGPVNVIVTLLSILLFIALPFPFAFL